jgi:hypothetical protein
MLQNNRMLHWSKTDEERRLCELWLKEPLINPETGHIIDHNGPTFEQWKQRCIRLGLSVKKIGDTNKMSWSHCQAWYKNPGRNPVTGKKILVGGPTYRQIKKQCECTEIRQELQGDYYLPDKNGVVPCVIERERRYALRKYQTRRVWGPLNKPPHNVQFCYFADTWDYNQGHFRPIFREGPPPRLPNQISSRPTSKQQHPKKIVDNILNLFTS